MHVRSGDGTRHVLPLTDWLSARRPGDDGLISRCVGSTLDVGCGPGHHTAAVTNRGLPVPGVDIAPPAVALARARGGPALCRSIFDRLPDTGDWQTALLADGNIANGGNPSRSGPVRLRLEADDDITRNWFRWASLFVTDIEPVARAAGTCLTETWQDHGRWFAALRPVSSPTSRPVTRSSTGGLS